MKSFQGDRRFIVSITLVATLGGLLFGYDTAVISGAVGSLNTYFIEPLFEVPVHASRVILEFNISVTLILMIIIVSISGILLKLFGRNKGLLFTGLICLATAGILMMTIWSHPPRLTESMANSLKGFSVSSALVGCIIGGTLAGFVSQNLGRKKGLIITAVLFAISATGSSLPEKMNLFGTEPVTSFIIYRIIGGIGVGLASMISPMYIAENAPAQMRGRLVSWNQFAIISGMVLVYFVNYVIALQGSSEWNIHTGWRWMFASETIPAAVFLVALLFVPETPRYLVLADKPSKALQVLNRLVGKEQASRVLEDIRRSLKQKTIPWLSFGGLLIVTGTLLAVFQQFVGINVVLYYAPEIFKSMGAGNSTALLQTIIVGGVNLTFTVIAIRTVDRFGRKPLMIIGALAMAASMISLGTLLFFSSAGIAALLLMLLYTAAFAVSWGPVTWVLLSEIFPNSVRGAMSIPVAAIWISNLIVSWTFPVINDNALLTSLFNRGFAYWIYGVMGILACLFVIRMVPETRGKSLEGMEQLWIRLSRKSV